MLLTILVFASLLGLAGLLFNNKKREVMNQFCYSECVEGKHYKENTNYYNMN